MSYIAKLNLKTVQRHVQRDPVIARREKLVAGIEEQGRVLAAVQAGDEYTVTVKRWRENEAGERELVDHDKRVRAWFFEQDGGWYVQCRYGSRVLNISGKSNAVFVDELGQVGGVLEAFSKAAQAGEFDKPVLLAMKPRSS